MRNLFLFIYKNYLFFLFLLLQSVAVFLLVQNNNFQKSRFLNSSNKVAGSMFQAYSNITDYFELKHTNEILSEENAKLRNQLKSSFYAYNKSEHTINDSIYKTKYTYINAKVVNNTTNKEHNYITINRGYVHGVRKGMAVISPNGVVGIVREVSDNFATIMSVLNKSSNIPVAIKKYNENGILQWKDNDYRYGYMANIPSHLNVKTGDTIVTSSYSSIFPSGIMSGFVTKVTPVEGNTFNELEVKFSVDFKKLSYVYVVNNLYRDEQEQLENKTLESDIKKNK